MPELPWDPLRLTTSPFYSALLPERHTWMQAFSDWPEVHDYAPMFAATRPAPVSGSGCPIVMVEQTEKPAWSRFEEVYEPRIYLKGELQTRRHNWHDFFNGLIWASFPRSKACINTWHYQLMRTAREAGADNRHRSPARDYLTQLDESGVVILARDPLLLDLIRTFSWKSLFWERRESLPADLKVYVFGHALLEQAPQPFIGMTARGLLLEAPAGFFDLAAESQLAVADETVAAHLADFAHIDQPRKLSPFPLLGYPGWHPDTGSEAFYDNTDYFRPGRRR